MQLYFFRHALAEIASVGQTDADRKLTQEGIDRTRQSARLLKLLDLTPIKLYTSPLVRAKQTPDILGHTLEIPIDVRKELAPGFNLGALTALVSDLALCWWTKAIAARRAAVTVPGCDSATRSARRASLSSTRRPSDRLSREIRP